MIFLDQYKIDHPVDVPNEELQEALRANPTLKAEYDAQLERTPVIDGDLKDDIRDFLNNAFKSEAELMSLDVSEAENQLANESFQKNSAILFGYSDYRHITFKELTKLTQVLNHSVYQNIHVHFNSEGFKSKLASAYIHLCKEAGVNITYGDLRNRIGVIYGTK